MFVFLRFINLCECLAVKKIPPRIGEANMDREIKKAMLEIQQSELEPLVKNLSVILDKLIELLITSYMINGQVLSLGSTVFETLCLVSNKLLLLHDDMSMDQNGRQALLSTYIQFQCKITHPLSDINRSAEHMEP